MVGQRPGKEGSNTDEKQIRAMWAAIRRLETANRELQSTGDEAGQPGSGDHEEDAPGLTSVPCKAEPDAQGER